MGKVTKSKLEFIPKLPIKNISILIQGPILETGNFTYQACQFYKRLYPDSQIVLSTWNYYPMSQISKFKNLGIEVVTSADIENPGPCNVNRQIVSTFQGLKVIDKENYVLKIRSDVILRSSVFLETLYCSLIEQESLGRRNRILVTSFNTFWRRPFSVNDQLQFGRYSDLVNFWNVPCDSRNIEEFNIPEMRDLLSWSKAEVCEVYLVRKYLEFLGADLPLTIQGGLQAIRDFFIVIDESMLGMYWSKTELRDLFELYRYQEIDPGPRIEQSDWMRMQISSRQHKSR